MQRLRDPAIVFMMIGVGMISMDIENTSIYVCVMKVNTIGSEDEAIELLNAIAKNIIFKPPKDANGVLNGLVILRDECAISFSPFHATLLDAAICYMQGQAAICHECAGLTLGG